MKTVWRCDAVFAGPDGAATVMLHPHAIQPNENTGLIDPTGLPGGAIALHMRDWLNHGFEQGRIYSVEILKQ